MPAEDGCNCDSRDGRDSRSKAGHCHISDRDGGQRGSCCKRARRQPRTTGRKRYRAEQSLSAFKWKKIGAAEGNSFQAQPSGRALEPFFGRANLQRQSRDTETAARTLSLKIESLEVRHPTEFDRAFKTATDRGVHGLLTMQSPLTTTYARRIVELAAKNQLPTMFGQAVYVEAGGLMSYAANLPDQARRAAVYVDKILKGTQPADLPVEQPTKFELVINLKAAKQIGLTIPPNVLARADKVIR